MSSASEQIFDTHGNPTLETLAKYNAGELPQATAAQVSNWLQHNKFPMEALEGFSAGDVAATAAVAQKAREKVATKTATQGGSAKWLLSIAATLLVALGGLWFFNKEAQKASPTGKPEIVLKPNQAPPLFDSLPQVASQEMEEEEPEELTAIEEEVIEFTPDKDGKLSPFELNPELAEQNQTQAGTPNSPEENSAIPEAKTVAQNKKWMKMAITSEALYKNDKVKRKFESSKKFPNDFEGYEVMNHLKAQGHLTPEWSSGERGVYTFLVNNKGKITDVAIESSVNEGFDTVMGEIIQIMQLEGTGEKGIQVKYRVEVWF